MHKTARCVSLRDPIQLPCHGGIICNVYLIDPRYLAHCTQSLLQRVSVAFKNRRMSGRGTRKWTWVDCYISLQLVSEGSAISSSDPINGARHAFT